MKCMKSELLAILPGNVRCIVQDKLIHELDEIRLRIGTPTRLVSGNKVTSAGDKITSEDLKFCVNTASKFSPWNASTISEGYLTAPGGHRIGLCGVCAGETIRNLTSLCIRVAKDIPDLGKHLPLPDSTLIIGPPGSGKTTLLRCLIRRLSRTGSGSIAVADERCELFPIVNGTVCFDPGENTDILSGKEKGSGIIHLLRSMGPEWIAVDEITSKEDCEFMVQAGWCGVKFLATAHAVHVSDLYSRTLYRPLLDTGLFHHVIVMHPDKTCHAERI